MKPLLLSMFSRNMLADPNLISEMSSITKEEAASELRRGAESYMPSKSLVEAVNNDLGTKVQYCGTTYLQLGAGQRAVIPTLQGQGESEHIRYTLVTIRSSRPSFLRWFGLST